MCGDGGAGKTWISKQAAGTFQMETRGEDYLPTIVCDFHVVRYDDLPDFVVNLWDTSGHVEFAEKRKQMYTDA